MEWFVEYGSKPGYYYYQSLAWYRLVGNEKGWTLDTSIPCKQFTLAEALAFVSECRSFDGRVNQVYPYRLVSTTGHTIIL